MIDMDKQDFLSKYHWLRDVDQILLMEAFDEALCFLKDSIAENVRLEQRMKSMNMVMGIPDHAVETMDYIYEEFQNLEGYRAYVDLWCDGEDPWKDKYYRHLIKRLQDGTDISSDIMEQGYNKAKQMEGACSLVIKMGICAEKMNNGILSFEDYEKLQNELIGILGFYETELTNNRSLIRTLIYDKAEVEETAEKNAELLADIRSEVIKSGYPLSTRLSALLDEVSASRAEHNEIEELPW